MWAKLLITVLLGCVSGLVVVAAELVGGCWLMAASALVGLLADLWMAFSSFGALGVAERGLPRNYVTTMLPIQVEGDFSG